MTRRQHRRKVKRGTKMLSTWEKFIISAAISLLTMLESKITNPEAKAAIEQTIDFLRKLVSGGVEIAS